MTLSWPTHLITFEEWEALPESELLRLELVEGMLVVSPAPPSQHQHAVMRLGYRTDEQLPRHLTALAVVEVVLGRIPPTVRVPDLVITRTELYETDPPRIDASDAVLVGEILADGTRRVDRVMKFAEYAEAGIAQYWIVDLEHSHPGSPTTLLAYTLANGHYELSGEHTGVTSLDIAGHPVTLDLHALSRR